MPPSRPTRRACQLAASIIVAGFAAQARAQIGDRLDRPGEVQRSLVPADQIPPAPARTPEEEKATIQAAPGIRVELAASDPLIEDPVAIAFGADGRMWVVEMRGYMHDMDGTAEDQAVCRIVVLKDSGGTGRYDEASVFLDHLVLPRALMLVGDGLLVGAPPELVYWRDAHGSGRADTKTVVATDYGVRVDPGRPFLANPERAPNSLLWAFDNWIYSAAYTRRFRFRDGTFESKPMAFRGQWGLTEDDFGRLYYNSNSDQLRVDLAAPESLGRNPDYSHLTGGNFKAAQEQFVWPARVNPGVNRGYRQESLWPDGPMKGRLKEYTAACAPFIYRGDLLPEFYGNAFIAEPAGNLVRRLLLSDLNGRVQGHNAYPEREFLASTDERFRPVNFATGPDGALYVVDFYRGVIQHRISVTGYLRRQSEERHLVAPVHLGRIWRIVPDRPAAARNASRAMPQTDEQWAERLSDPNGWWEDTAQRILVEHHDSAVAPQVRTIALKGGAPMGRVHAIWTLEGMDALDRETALACLVDADPHVRVAALKAAEPILSGEIRQRALALSRDPSPEVRLQAVLSLGAQPDLETALQLAPVLWKYPTDTLLRDAFLSGVGGLEPRLLERFASDPAWQEERFGVDRLLGALAQGVAAGGVAADIDRVRVLAAAAPEPRRKALDAGLAAGTRPHYDPHPRPLTAEEKARFDAGKTLFTAVCAACHQVTGRGLEGLAPPLVDSPWLLGAPERPVKIVLKGLQGEINVEGHVYMGEMPALATFSDEQIADILTYLRREWGHASAPVDPALVKAQRLATVSRVDAWGAQELDPMGETRRGLRPKATSGGEGN